MTAYDFTAGFAADRNADLTLIDVGGADAIGTGNSSSITLTQGFTLDRHLYAVDLQGAPLKDRARAHPVSGKKEAFVARVNQLRARRQSVTAHPCRTRPNEAPAQATSIPTSVNLSKQEIAE